MIAGPGVKGEGLLSPPMARVVQEYMKNLNDRLNKFTDPVTISCSTLSNDRDKETYQDHLVVWIEHSEHLKDRAREVIFTLEAAHTTVNPAAAAVNTPEVVLQIIAISGLAYCKFCRQ